MNSHFAAQWVVVGVVVAASTAYAAWTLMPVALRRALAAVALRLPLPAAIAVRLRAQATSASSCSCSGCDANIARAQNSVAASSDAARPMTFHRRLPR